MTHSATGKCARMRIFDYKSRGRGGGFVAALTESQARDYLVAQGCAKKPANIRLREVDPDSIDDYSTRYQDILRRGHLPCLIHFEQRGAIARAVAWHRKPV